MLVFMSKTSSKTKSVQTETTPGGKQIPKKTASTKAVTIARGDGIGPEIMDVVLSVMDKVVSLSIEEIEIGEKVYAKGGSVGIEESAWKSLHRTKTLLKAPITTPQGGGFRSLNVAVRKMLGLYANIRPCVSYHPFVSTKHPKMDVTVIRENEEDLYTGIEYRQTRQVTQCLKLLSRRGSEKIIRYAFEYARKNGRKKVTCLTKDNIMQMSDGMFHRVFEETAKEYPDLESEHWIVDIGMAKIAHTPEKFDVVVVPNLYGDILSDITAQISGSVGLSGSANIGAEYAMFEAIHGSAPRRAGQNLANPSGLLLASAQMLSHLNLTKESALIQNAFLKTLEDGLHTYDIYRSGCSRKKVGTKEFGRAVEDRLGEQPRALKPAVYSKGERHSLIGGKGSVSDNFKTEKKQFVGVDVFIDGVFENPSTLACRLQKLEGSLFKLESLSSRGIAFWPGALPRSDSADHWCCRFTAKTQETALSQKDIIDLLTRLTEDGQDCIKTENLYNFDGKPGFSSVSRFD